MTGRTSLLEQKKLQWAKEREEMARFGGSWGLMKQGCSIRTTIRTYPTGARMSLAEMKDKQTSQPFRASGHYGSTISLKSLTTESSGNGTTSLKYLDCNGGSLINLHDQTDISQVRRRSPSLPPIYNKDQQQCSCQDQQRDFGVEGLRYQSHKPQKSHHHHHHRGSDRHESQKEAHHYGPSGEEREGETSGYASDSIDAPMAQSCKAHGVEMTEKTWQNPYYATSESSLPPSRRLSAGRIGELNRPRWGSVWGQDTARGDPPPPSWLARLGHSSQVLVINHDSASSPDSSTTGSTGSDTAKTYLRGQNIHVDSDILQEREMKRQKALELQNAIKQQLEEKDRQKKAEKERRLREEKLEEERIQRERNAEKQRFEEEQRRLKEKEEAKQKKAETMREMLQAAERLANEEKKNRRKRCETDEETVRFSPENKHVEAKVCEKNHPNGSSTIKPLEISSLSERTIDINSKDQATKTARESETSSQTELEISKEETNQYEKSEKIQTNDTIRVPISKDVAIVLSGRLEDSEILNKANLQLVNLVVTPSPRKFETNPSSNLSLSLNAVTTNGGSPISPLRNISRMAVVENRLLTPSKYRTSHSTGRDFGTQTDVENDLQDLREKLQDSSTKDGSTKERKDTTNASRRDEKSTNVGTTEELTMKVLPRSKSQPRPSLDSRPRWNANRPGTRYRTQSEKDPHYQRRLRLRRRQVESSDEGSRSPSPDQRKVSNTKTKPRNQSRRKVKLDSYDADLSMDSLNSIVPLRIDKNGKINLEETKNERNSKVHSDNDHVNEMEHTQKSESENSNIWCGQEILSKLSSLRNGLLMKQIEWDSERCLVSPAATEIF